MGGGSGNDTAPMATVQPTVDIGATAFVPASSGAVSGNQTSPDGAVVAKQAEDPDSAVVQQQAVFEPPAAAASGAASRIEIVDDHGDDYDSGRPPTAAADAADESAAVVSIGEQHENPFSVSSSFFRTGSSAASTGCSPMVARAGPMSAAITTAAATQQSCNDAPRSSGSRLRHLQQQRRRRKKSTLIPLGHATANTNGALLHPEADDDDEHSRLPNPFSVAISPTAGPAAATVTAGAAQGLSVDAAGVRMSNASASPDDDGCKLDDHDDDDEGDEGDDDDNADDDDGEPEQSQCADGSSELLGWSDAQPQDALGNAAASTARVRGAASTQRQYAREDDAGAGSSWSMPGDLEPAAYATRMSMSSVGVAATAHRDAAAAAAAAAEHVQALQAKTLALQSEATAAALTLEQARRERKLRAVRMEIATLRAELERDATIV